ncbi:High mobility group [Cichlidogyrus casuarinus]|uniref:High mobility group n=1 Tax=Cichlidogyrus casuarinus TaxID=1844966 RepID=A0ABD2QLL8_9PLAT
MSEFTKKCAEKWKQMAQKDRKRFEDIALMDKNRYPREQHDFSNASTNILSSGSDSIRRKKRKRTKDPAMPKRAWSAFFFFSHEMRPSIREDHPDWRVSEVAKELGKRWEDCQDKTKYEAQAQADRQRYEEEMLQYKNGTYVPGTKSRLSAEERSTPGPINDDFFEDDEVDDHEESLLSVSENSAPSQSAERNSSDDPPISFDARTLAQPSKENNEHLL